ncbi:hypothetical protein H4219_001928 [Mycoemilia scoparia]|uniref:Uncharacterized protein n=1 Tax=Mycoemilia scoparia TaxID=417184 RepID=A0A9W8DPQ7_9FUNG|nr:hypothetical protein H4219_001928 [Mycoemilia scoparia]
MSILFKSLCVVNLVLIMGKAAAQETPVFYYNDTVEANKPCGFKGAKFCDGTPSHANIYGVCNGTLWSTMSCNSTQLCVEVPDANNGKFPDIKCQKNSQCVIGTMKCDLIKANLIYTCDQEGLWTNTTCKEEEQCRYNKENPYMASCEISHFQGVDIQETSWDVQVSEPSSANPLIIYDAPAVIIARLATAFVTVVFLSQTAI